MRHVAPPGSFIGSYGAQLSVRSTPFPLCEVLEVSRSPNRGRKVGAEFLGSRAIDEYNKSVKLVSRVGISPEKFKGAGVGHCGAAHLAEAT